MEATTAADADADADAGAGAGAGADAMPLGAVDVPNRQPRAPRSTAGPTVTAITVAKNAHILLVDTRRKRPSPT